MSKASPVSIEVERRTRPVFVLVRITGELDFGTTPRLLDAVEGEPPRGTSMVLDLTELGFCDSSALGAMICLHKAARRAGGRLYLTGAHPQVIAAIRVTSLDQLFEIRADVSELATGLGGHQFITGVYAVHDPADETLTYANAGHLPPALIRPGGPVEFLDDRLGMPLRIGHDFAERRIPFPPGSSLVLYTDGLVERGRRPLPDTLAELETALADVAVAADTGAACDQLIDLLTRGGFDDDVALLYARERAPGRRRAGMALTADTGIAAPAASSPRPCGTGAWPPPSTRP